MQLDSMPALASELHSVATADPKASEALRAATSTFSRKNTGEVVAAVNTLIQGFLRTTLPSTSSWTKVYTFGSSGLGAAIAGSDIDLIALCSSTIDVNLFFTQFPHFIDGRLADLVIVTSTRVPLLKFSHNGVHVDLLFASVDLAEPPSNDDLLHDDFLLRVSETSRATVNGIRTVLEITRRLRVPQADYVCVLRAVKYWATQRQVYGNLYTFPNGVCLAILVARATQLCPVTDPSALLRVFFALYVRWLTGPARVQPVSIVPPEHSAPMAVVMGMTRAWEATRDSNDLFPILNPARPTINAAYTVGRSGLQLSYKELLRAHRLLERHAAAGADAPPYRELWARYSILQDYHYFVSVHIAGVDESAAGCENALNAWKGYIESKLRLLVYSLECLVEVRPFPRSVVDSPTRSISEDGVTLQQSSRAFYFGLKRGSDALQRSDIATALTEFEFAVDDGSSGRYGFARDVHRMRGPWFSFFANESTGLQSPALLALRAACVEGF